MRRCIDRSLFSTVVSSGASSSLREREKREVRETRRLEKEIFQQ